MNNLAIICTHKLPTRKREELIRNIEKTAQSLLRIALWLHVKHKAATDVEYIKTLHRQTIKLLLKIECLSSTTPNYNILLDDIFKTLTDIHTMYKEHKQYLVQYSGIKFPNRKNIIDDSIMWSTSPHKN